MAIQEGVILSMGALVLTAWINFFNRIRTPGFWKSPWTYVELVGMIVILLTTWKSILAVGV